MDVRGTDDLELRVAWQQHVSIDMDELETVLARHREPHRRYHGEQHVRWVVRHATHLASSKAVTRHAQRVDLGAIIAAAFYHDIVYDPRRSDNEAVSARLAANALARGGWEAKRVEAVAKMIEATVGHTQAPGPTDLSTAVLLAADLGVLAAEPAGYNAYVAGVRFEYSHVPEGAWAVGRSAVLRSFIGRPHIFPPDLDLREWEARARGNIAAELATLNASS